MSKIITKITMRQTKIKVLVYKFIKNRSDEEIERRVKKCSNYLYWDIAELEAARRKALEYEKFFL